MNTPPLPVAVTASTLSTDLREATRLSRSMGFEGLLFEIGGSASPLLSLSSTGQRDVRQILASQRQAMIGLALRLPPRALRPESDIEQALAFVQRAMEATRNLGSQMLCVDLGLLPPAPPDPAPPRPKIDPAMAGLILIPDLSTSAAPPPPPAPTADPAFTASITDSLRHLCQHADRLGVMVSISSALSGFRAIEAVLNHVDCPWFGLDLDPAGLLEDDWSMDELFDRLGTRIRHVRGRDAIRGTDRRTQPAAVGRGDTDWPALLSNLDSAGYRSAITLDPAALPDRIAAARAGLAHLRPPTH